MKIILRKASAEDMLQIHTLVYELAVFEKAPEQVSTTEEVYRRDGFEENRFDVIVAEDTDLPKEKSIIGMALTYWAYSTWKGKYLWLEDLIVTENYRGKGIGKMLFDSVLEKCIEEQAELLRWQVLDWNNPAISFYDKYNTFYQKEWVTCKLSIEAIKEAVKKPI
ncbi:MAG: N-acetyltransferase family protein [Chitinophagales bacterium]